MKYEEKVMDLFSLPNDYWLAHCISADFSLGKGIAVEFNKHFDMKRQLIRSAARDNWTGKGYCLTVRDIPVFNLVTKERYWMKPTYQTVSEALLDMLDWALAFGVKKIATPMIGCGLDKLKWEAVSSIIRATFEETDIEILVCIRP